MLHKTGYSNIWQYQQYTACGDGKGFDMMESEWCIVDNNGTLQEMRS